jgi:hypothetical protein
MTALSTLPGSMSAGLNALSSPFGSNLPSPLLAQLLGRTGAGGMPGSLAPQIPMLPGGPRGAAGPVPAIPPAAQPPQSNLLSLLGSLGGAKPPAGGSNPAAPFSWSASSGLFGGDGPLFGTTGLFGSYGPLLNSFAGTDAASLGYGGLLGGSAAAAASLPEGMSLADMLAGGLIAM